MNYKLEVIGFNIESCDAAQRFGAHRIELCDNPLEGGTTPSYGFIKEARKKLAIELYVMIRPRGGDFLYADEEFEIMKDDIKNCKSLGCNGVVFGLLDEEGCVDKTRCSRLAELAYPMGITFHRAFDHAANPFEALEHIIEMGFERILSSGQMPTAPEGAELLDQLIRQAAERIIIMPGSGIRSDNIARLAEKTGAREFHSSARKDGPVKMKYFNPNIPEQLSHVIADENEIGALVNQLNLYFSRTHE